METLDYPDLWLRQNEWLLNHYVGWRTIPELLTQVRQSGRIQNHRCRVRIRRQEEKESRNNNTKAMTHGTSLPRRVFLAPVPYPIIHPPLPTALPGSIFTPDRD
jgi:hypothetical protein